MSGKTLNDLLRKQMGFEGIIISDDMTMGAIAKEYSLKDALKKAIDGVSNMQICPVLITC